MTVLSQIQTGSGIVVAYYKGVALYLTDTGEEVNISTLDGFLPYDDLLTYTNANAQQSGNFAVGLAIEALSDFAAIQRELDMTRQTKIELMDSAASEATDDAQIYEDTSTYQTGVLSGSATSGSQS